MWFRKGKVQSLYLGRKNCTHQFRLGNYLLESSSAEDYLGVLVDNRLPMSQHYTFVAKKARAILWSIKKKISSQLRSHPSQRKQKGTDCTYIKDLTELKEGVAQAIC